MNALPVLNATKIAVRKRFFALQSRVNSALTATAEEKYIKLTNGYPDIIARVPQHMIASYLGLTGNIKPGEKTNYPS
jgi:hypothetical protein